MATNEEAPIIPHIWKPAPVRRRHWNADRMKQDKRIRTTSYVASGNGYAVSRDLTPRLVLVADCKPLGRETRKHPPHQVRKLAASLNRFGLVLPILIDPEQRVVAGWAWCRPPGNWTSARCRQSA